MAYETVGDIPEKEFLKKAGRAGEISDGGDGSGQEKKQKTSITKIPPQEISGPRFVDVEGGGGYTVERGWTGGGEPAGGKITSAEGISKKEAKKKEKKRGLKSEIPKQEKPERKAPTIEEIRKAKNLGLTVAQLRARETDLKDDGVTAVGVYEEPSLWDRFTSEMEAARQKYQEARTTALTNLAEAGGRLPAFQDIADRDKGPIYSVDEEEEFPKKKTVEHRTPTQKELWRRNPEQAAEQEITMEWSKEKTDVEAAAGRVEEELVDKYQEKVDEGEVTVEEAREQMQEEYEERMEPVFKESRLTMQKKREAMREKVNKIMDRRQALGMFGLSAATSASYTFVGAIAPPIGIGAMIAGGAKAYKEREAIGRYAEKRPLSFGASIAGSLLGAYGGAKLGGAVRTAYYRKKFQKQLKKSNIKILGVEKKAGTGKIQNIIGKTRIMGDDYIIRIKARGIPKGKGKTISAGKGYTIRIVDGKARNVVGFQNIGASKVTGKARAVKPGQSLTLKQAIGKGFIGRGVTRKTFDVEIKPTKAGFIGRGKIYPGSQFKRTPEMAGVYKTGRINLFGKEMSATRLLMGKSQPKYSTVQTDYGWVYAPTKKTFKPKISGYILQPGRKGGGAGTTGGGVTKQILQQQGELLSQAYTGFSRIGGQVARGIGRQSFLTGLTTGAGAGVRGGVETEQIARQRMSGVFNAPRPKQVQKPQAEQPSQSFSGLLTGQTTQVARVTREKEKQVTRPFTKFKDRRKEKVRPLTALSIKTATEAEQKARPMSILSTGETTKPAAKGRPLTILSTMPAEKQEVEQKTVTTRPPTQTTPTPVMGLNVRMPGEFIPGLFMPEKEPRYRKKGRVGYQTFVRRKGKWKKITDKPMTKSGARSKGARRVDNTVARSFKTEPIKEKKTVKGKAIEVLKRFGRKQLEKGDNYFSMFRSQLRKPIKKGRPQKQSSVFIEKSEGAISTRGEKSELRVARKRKPLGSGGKSGSKKKQKATINKGLGV